MHEELWSTDRQTDRLRTLRADGRTVWDDSAEREVSARWLDPHDRLASMVVSGAREQHEAIEVARREEAEAQAQAQVASTRASDTATSLHQLDDAAERGRAAATQAVSVADHATRLAHEARAGASETRRILTEAR